MSFCGKNHVGLWEKFGEQSIVLDNSSQFVGKIRWTENFTEINLPITGKKTRIIYVYLPRYRISQRLFDGKFAET